MKTRWLRQAFSIGFLFFTTLVNGKTYDVAVQTDIVVGQLKKNSAIVLIQLDVDGIAPSLEFSSVNKKRKLVNVITNQTFIVQLENIEKGAYLLELPIGDYQITKVNAPFYNLPFYINTQELPVWGFSVYPNVVNYIGELSIAKERSSNLIDVNFHHRIAAHLPEFQQKFAHLFDQYPLKLSFAKRDLFLEALINE